MFLIGKRIVICTFFLILFIFDMSASDFKEEKSKYLSGRRLDTLEGLWIKTFANQGPKGCITMFFKTDQDIYNQIHIDSCFVLDKITGKQKKTNNTTYNGENAIYYYDGKVDWSPSKIELSDDYGSFSITHMSHSNTFVEKWRRVWPENLDAYNKEFDDNKNK